MRKATIVAAAAALVLAAFAAPASATNGYFSHGYGTHYKGMAGGPPVYGGPEYLIRSVPGRL